MGYIRLVRSSALDCSSTSALFIPDLQDVMNFSEACENLPISDETLTAAGNLDGVISNITDNFQHNTDYFKVRIFFSFHIYHDSEIIKNLAFEHLLLEENK